MQNRDQNHALMLSAALEQLVDFINDPHSNAQSLSAVHQAEALPSCSYDLASVVRLKHAIVQHKVVGPMSAS